VHEAVFCRWDSLESLSTSCLAGEWPHASERVDSLPPGVKRVIVGFNVFGSNVAEANLRAPEHSAQFNSTVKRYQLASKLAPVADKPEDASIDLHALRSNPVLSRLLVSLGRAKREVECAASTAPKAGDAVDALWKSGLRMCVFDRRTKGSRHR